MAGVLSTAFMFLANLIAGAQLVLGFRSALRESAGAPARFALGAASVGAIVTLLLFNRCRRTHHRLKVVAHYQRELVDVALSEELRKKGGWAGCRAGCAEWVGLVLLILYCSIEIPSGFPVIRAIVSAVWNSCLWFESAIDESIRSNLRMALFLTVCYVWTMGLFAEMFFAASIGVMGLAPVRKWRRLLPIFGKLTLGAVLGGVGVLIATLTLPERGAYAVSLVSAWVVVLWRVWDEADRCEEAIRRADPGARERAEAALMRGE